MVSARFKRTLAVTLCIAIGARFLACGVSNCFPNSIKWVVLCWSWRQEVGVSYRLDPTEWVFYLMTETSSSPKHCFKYKHVIDNVQKVNHWTSRLFQFPWSHSSRFVQTSKQLPLWTTQNSNKMRVHIMTDRWKTTFLGEENTRSFT
jgi:hypothetical protein